MELKWMVLIGLAVLIIAVLAAVAAKLLWQLRHQRRREQRVGEENIRRAQDGLRILAGSFLAGQVDASEASLRIAVLLDQPGQPQPLREAGRDFTELAAQLAHIPTHQAWKDLPAARRRGLRNEMDVLESRHHADLQTAARALLERLSGPAVQSQPPPARQPK